MGPLRRIAIRWWPWGLLGLVFLMGWRPLFFADKVPVDGNLLRLSYPNWVFSRLSETPFHWPLWNPFRNMGEPFLADPQTMAAYPISWLLNQAWSFHASMCAWVLVHTAIAAIFTAKLVNRWYDDTCAAWVAAAIIGLNACFTSRLSIPNHFASAAYIPMAFYFLETGSVVGLGVSLALQWLAGFPPYSVMTGFALCCGVAVGRRRRITTLVYGGLLALGLAAVQWIPFVELFRHSARPLILPSGLAQQFSESISQLAKMIIMPQWIWFWPQLRGDPAIVSFYVGVPALGVAVWACVRGSAREKWLMAGFAAACLMSLEDTLSGASWLLPVRLFRFPAHWLLLGVWCLAILCGSGISRLRSHRLKVMLAGLVAVDLIGFAQAVRVAWMPPTFVTEVPVLAQKLLSSPYPTRLYYPDSVMEASLNTTLRDLPDYVAMKEDLYPSIGMAFGVREMSSYQVLMLTRARDYLGRLYREGRASPLLRWAGVSCLMVTQQSSVSGNRVSLVAIKTTGFKPPLFISDEKVASKIVPKTYVAGNVQATVSVDKPATLVFSEVDYPGWQARIDNKPIPLGLFENTFLSVPVPKGIHGVEFAFRPLSFQIGFTISLGVWLGLILFLFRREGFR